MVTRFPAILVAASFAMLVAGCGGGGGDDEVKFTAQLANLTPEQKKQAATAAGAAAGMEPREVEDGDTSGISQSSNADQVSVEVVSDGGPTYTIKSAGPGGSPPRWEIASDDEGEGFKSQDIARRVGKELSKKVDDGTVYADVYSHYTKPSEGEDGGTDYLAGGVWLYVPDSGERYSFGAFVSGNDPTNLATANNGAVVGKATYRGNAMGWYLGKSGKIGYLDGIVSLTADFGDGTSPFDLSGQITNIRKDGASTNGQLELESLDPDDSGDVTGTGAYEDYTGHWGGKFFGTKTLREDANDEKTYPGYVGGTFGAAPPPDGEGGTLAGMFGADFLREDTTTTSEEDDG